jgi:hypothetical protein
MLSNECLKAFFLTLSFFEKFIAHFDSLLGVDESIETCMVKILIITMADFKL